MSGFYTISFSYCAKHGKIPVWADETYFILKRTTTSTKKSYNVIWVFTLDPAIKTLETPEQLLC